MSAKLKLRSVTASSLALTCTLLIAPLPAALAQTEDRAGHIAEKTTMNAAINDTELALAALKSGDYQVASRHLEFAATQTAQLNIRSIANRLAAAAPAISAEDIKFANAGSSVLSFDTFEALSRGAETTHTDEKGRTVTVRIFSSDAALEAFSTAADDKNSMEKNNLQFAMMGDEPAIKKRGTDGSFSVVMMSEKDHALIEIEGMDEASVMTLVETLEQGQN